MTDTKNKSLNLRYVSDVIGEDYKNWKNGDIGLIVAQTGTGKTFFITGNDKIDGLIDKLSLDEKLIYLCNRSALKRQVKLDVMKKYKIVPPILKDENGEPFLSDIGKMQIDFAALDNIHTIGQVTISSYHAIAHTEQNTRYLKEDASNLDNYKYIVCDEIQFVLTDSSYMNKTNLVYDKVIKEYYPSSIIVYISATMDEVLPVIQKAFESNMESGYTIVQNKIHHYSTGIDYSYLNIKYFQSDRNIVELISNDISDEKWLVFVTSEKAGLKIKEELSNYDIESVFVKSGTTNDETKSIIDNGNFNCKILISTKVFDNGINIKDSSVKNVVVCAYDKTTFLQEIGRVRIDIKNPPTINLYIKSMNSRIFKQRIDDFYQPKIDDVKLFYDNSLGFKQKFNMDVDKVYSDIFYLDEKNEWQINSTGYARVLKDYDFAVEMVGLFKNNKFAYIQKQLEWLELSDSFSENNFIEDIISSEDITALNQFLEKSYNDGVEYSKKFFIDEIMKIIDNSMSLKSILNKLDGKHTRSKGIKVFNKLFDACNLSYVVGSTRKMKSNRRNTIWILLSTQEK